MNRGFLKGFTLAELLVATLVLSIMLVVMAPVMTKKAKARVEQKVEIVQAQQETLPVGANVLWYGPNTVYYTYLRAQEMPEQLVCSLLLDKNK